MNGRWVRLGALLVGSLFTSPAFAQQALQRDLDTAAGRLQNLARSTAGDLRPFRSVHPACRDALDELSDLLESATRLRRLVVEGADAESARDELRSIDDSIDRLEDHLQDIRVDLRPDQSVQHRRLDQRLDVLTRQVKLMEDTTQVLDDLVARWRDLAAQGPRDGGGVSTPPPAASWNYLPGYTYPVYPVVPYGYPYGLSPYGVPAYGGQYIELHTHTGPSTGGHHHPQPGPVRSPQLPRPTAQQKYGTRGGAGTGYPNR